MGRGVVLLAETSGSTGNAEWYTVVGGIIAVPIAIIGAVATLYTIRKTNLESRKILLDIEEKKIN